MLENGRRLLDGDDEQSEEEVEEHLLRAAHPHEPAPVRVVEMAVDALDARPGAVARLVRGDDSDSPLGLGGREFRRVAAPAPVWVDVLCVAPPLEGERVLVRLPVGDFRPDAGGLEGRGLLPTCAALSRASTFVESKLAFMATRPSETLATNV